MANKNRQPVPTRRQFGLGVLAREHDRSERGTMLLHAARAAGANPHLRVSWKRIVHPFAQWRGSVKWRGA